MGLLSKIIIVLMVIIFFGGFLTHLFLQERDGAKTFCEGLNKTYEFNWKNQKHYCDGKIISELTLRGYDGAIKDEFWGFVEDYKNRNINLTK